jgi:hypothetical protein
MSKEVQENREAFLRKYSTTTPSGHLTFDQERYYNDMPTEEMVTLRDKTLADLKRSPGFATEYYTNFAEYLTKKLEDRKNVD